MNKTVVVAGLLAGLCATSIAHADVGITGSLGTTGLGAHLTIPLNQKFNARLGINTLHYDFDGSTDDVKYDFKLKLRTFDALLDFYPGSSGFRLTGGVVYNGNKVNANALPAAGGTYTINGTVYNAADVGSVNGKIDFRNVAPYLGIGWGTSPAKQKGWSFAADLGVMFQGSPRTSLTNTGCTAAPAICNQLASDLAVENADLRKEVDDFKAYPVLRVGVNYTF